MYEIIPSPGTQDREWAAIEKKIELVKPFVKTIHIDVIDGKFAPNTSFADPVAFERYTKASVGNGGGLIFEVHLMVEEPIQHLKKWADAGFRRFIGQIEKMSDQEEFVAQGQLLGEVALGVDGPTSLDAVKVPYEDLDAMLFYTGDKAGFSGKSFMPDRLEKIKVLRAKMPDLPIEIDGGVNDETIQMAYAAGVTRFVTTKFLFDLNTPQEQFDLLMHKLQELQV